MSDDDILSQLDWEPEETPAPTDVTTLSNYDLSSLNRDTREELISLGEMLATPNQQSERGKELHSIFLATTIEIQKRMA